MTRGGNPSAQGLRIWQAQNNLFHSFMTSAKGKQSRRRYFQQHEELEFDNGKIHSSGRLQRVMKGKGYFHIIYINKRKRTFGINDLYLCIKWTYFFSRTGWKDRLCQLAQGNPYKRTSVIFNICCYRRSCGTEPECESTRGSNTKIKPLIRFIVYSSDKKMDLFESSQNTFTGLTA